jgi:hypothetical protein
MALASVVTAGARAVFLLAIETLVATMANLPPSVILGPARTGTTEELAREFGPWVRGADGRWKRDRRKR